MIEGSIRSPLIGENERLESTIGMPQRTASTISTAANGFDEGFTDSVVGPQYTGSNRELRPFLGLAIYAIVLIAYGGVVMAGLFFPREPFLSSRNAAALNVPLLAVTGLLQRYLAKEQQCQRRMGYLRFCRRMELIVQLPFTAVATGNSAALLMVLWSPPHYDSPDTQWPLRSVLLAEVFTVSTLLVYYTWNVQEHRNVDKLPDVHQSLTSALRASAPLDNCRYDDGDLAERQAELIRFQQDSVRHLSREILRLQERLSKYESSEDGGNTREDMENILAAREQSVGALTAERDHLLSELRQARFTIGERDSETARMQSLIQQHVDENARLRAMLDEWSARNAKMEIAYEQEKRRYNELRRRVAASASSSGLARKPSSSTSLATPSLAQSPPVS